MSKHWYAWRKVKFRVNIQVTSYKLHITYKLHNIQVNIQVDHSIPSSPSPRDEYEFEFEI